MKQNAFDDTRLLSFTCQGDKAVVGVVAIAGKHALHPLWSARLDIVVDRVAHKRLDMAATDSYDDHADLDILRQSRYHLTTEIVDGR